MAIRQYKGSIRRPGEKPQVVDLPVRRVAQGIAEAVTETGGLWHVNSDRTVSDDLFFAPGSKVFVDASVTLTLGGYVSGGAWHMFDGDGDVVFE